jgi:hypothetical protein
MISCPTYWHSAQRTEFLIANPGFEYFPGLVTSGIVIWGDIRQSEVLQSEINISVQ